MFDLAGLRAAVTDHDRVARVVIAAHDGSSPREVGAAMLVWASGQSGTVGGGALEWEALETPDADYTVSVHLLNGNGALVAQHDGPPRSNTAPTSTWQAGEIISDHHGVALPRDLAAGMYHLYVLRTRKRNGLIAHDESLFLFRLDQCTHQITPNCLPTSVNALMAISMSCDECAADICVLIRALPCGTTGKKNPVTYIPCS